MAKIDALTAEPQRRSIPLPRPLWFGLLILFLIALAAGLRVSLPISRERAAARELGLLGAKFEFASRGPEWLQKHTSLGYVVNRAILDDADVADADLIHLRNLTNLRVLSLDRTQLSDAGLIRLKDMTHLQRLSLNATNISDAGLPHLQSLTSLQSLDLGRTKITDVGLIRLSGLTNLQDLDLGGTVVTDAGLMNLKSMTSLRRLVLRSVLADKRITPAGIAELQRAMPDLKIRRF